jgi:hypothetical protein
MKYLLLICTEPTRADNEDRPGDLDIDQWLDYVKDKRIIGERVRPASDATTVRSRGGEVLVTDGPYAETKEHMAGFDVIDCKDLDEAIEIAAKHPVARFGMVEVRPFWEGD